MPLSLARVAGVSIGEGSRNDYVALGAAGERRNEHGMDAVFYFDGEWLSEAPKLTGPMNQSFWLSAVVFDGARA